MPAEVRRDHCELVVRVATLRAALKREAVVLMDEQPARRDVARHIQQPAPTKASQRRRGATRARVCRQREVQGAVARDVAEVDKGATGHRHGRALELAR